MYETFEKLLHAHNVKVSDVARATGIRPSTFSDWKNGHYTPKRDKLQKIADFFNVSIEYLETGKAIEKTSVEGNRYYFDDFTAKLAQEFYENPRMRALMDAAKDLSPDDLALAEQIIEKLKRSNPYG